MKRKNVIVLAICVVGLFFRLVGNNWDQGWHLHPDERFLTMVGMDVEIPSSFDRYLDQRSSSFNPVNKNHTFYVYGTLPVFLNKVLARFLFNDTYALFNLQGRVLSGCADFVVVLIVYALCKLGEKRLKFKTSVKYIAAFLYAISVLPIQLSHFYTVDTFLNLFCWMSLYFAIKYLNTSQNGTRYTLHATRYVCLSGLSLGLAFACKISAIYITPLIGALIALRLYKTKKSFLTQIVLLSVFIFSCYGALRLGSPYYFETNNFFNPEISKTFTNNIKTLKSFENPQGLYPPSVQWLSKSVSFQLINLTFFGVGPVYFVCILLGIFLLFKKRNVSVLVSVLWVIVFTAYQSVQFSKNMRYMFFVYPFLACFAGVGLSYVFNIINSLSSFLRYTLCVVCCVGILLWPLAFMSIYTKDHSRVEASQWIYSNVPAHSSLSYEYWDDPLPLAVQDPASRNFSLQEIHIFDPDTKEKWDIIDSQLKRTDYYVMSSNRGWGSIPAVPKQYPIASRFYNDMLHHKNGFVLLKEFTSYPSLRYLGIPIDFPDQWADESFTVYDHPMVKIFKKQ